MENEIHRQYTVEEKITHVQNYLSSGKTLVAYCRETGVKRPTLYSWLKLYGTQEAVPAFQNVTPILKQDVSEAVAAVSPMVRITLPNGILIECPPEVIRIVLRELR